MATGAAWPRFSLTFGPVGTSGSAGGAPRPSATKRHRSARLSSSHSHGAPRLPYGEPAAPLSDAVVTAFTRPVADSAIHSSMPAARVAVNASIRPLGEKATQLSVAPGGVATVVCTPVLRFSSVMPMSVDGRCGPFVRGLTRYPASRYIGCASSLMDGMLRRSSSATVSRDGLTSAVGSGGASRMSTMTCGGVRYETAAWIRAWLPTTAARTSAVAEATAMRRARMGGPPQGGILHCAVRDG